MSIFHVLMVAAAATMSSSPLFHTAEVLVEVTENIEYQVSDDAQMPHLAMGVATRRDNVL